MQRRLNNGKGYVLCHLRKVTAPMNGMNEMNGMDGGEDVKRTQSEDEEIPPTLGKQKIVSGLGVDREAEAIYKTLEWVPDKHAEDLRVTATSRKNSKIGLKNCCKLMQKIERFVAKSRREEEQVDYVQLYKVFNGDEMCNVVDPIFIPSM